MTTRTLWLTFGLIALIAGSWPGTTASASNETAERLDLQCTHCHDKPGSRLLTDDGKYWEVMRSFDGLEEVTATFGACTECHVRKPGSLKLTRNGRAFERLVGDMQGLKTLLEKQHPVAPVEEEGDGSEEGASSGVE